MTNYGVEDYRRKADQHWEMAGLARMDGDKKDAERHSKLAQKYDKMAAEEWVEWGEER